MNRNGLKELALIRLKEVESLLKNGLYEGAYYLCGYVVECGLKACIAKQTKQYDFPDKNTVNESYTHDLTKLVKIAGLLTELESKTKSEKKFEVYWSWVKDWKEESRYKRHTEKEARNLYFAITEKEGVLKSIEQHW